MLSDEEREALEILKAVGIRCKGINIDEVIINLIEKQSKEIEELKYKYSDEKIRNTIIKRYREVIEKDYVSKDKIKAKIDYIKNRYNIEEDYVQYKTVVIMLQSLLEKE